MKKAFLLMAVAILISCSGEQFNEKPEKVVEKTTIVPSSAVATVLNISTAVKNGGKVGTLSVTGNGVMEVSEVDATTGEVSRQPYTILSEGSSSVTLDKDTTEVEKFGVEVIGYPESSTEDISSDEKSGLKTTMETWKLSDGQSATGLMSWAYTKAQTTAELPHALVENLRLNKVVSIEVLDERHAKVTLSFLVEVKGVNSKTTTGAGEQEIKVSYIQALPEPEKPTPTWSLTFARTSERAGSATLTITLSDGTSVAFPWNAISCGLFGDMKSLFVTDTKVVEDSTLQVSNDYPSGGSITNSKRGGISWQLTKNCQEVHERRFWRLCGGGIDGAKPKVYFYTTDVTAVLPTGEKIEVHLHPKTAFGEDSFSTIESLIGNIIAPENENKEYVYNKSFTYSADHYVSCTVVDFDGTEKEFPVDCLENGLLLHNSGTVNLYTLK